MMSKEQQKQALMIGGAALAILIALVLIFKQATKPSETIVDEKTIAPKGALKAAQDAEKRAASKSGREIKAGQL